MTSGEQRVNPYQPPPDVASDHDSDAPLRLAFQLNKRLRRHAEEQYLLHWHQTLLLLSSLAMIGVSCGVMIISILLSVSSFLPALVLVMAVSAAIYSALVRRSKQRIRRQLEIHGLMRDEMIEMVTDPQQLTLNTASGTWSWPNPELSIRRTTRGLLICPEPYLFVFIPKRADIRGRTYRQFVRLMESRATGERSPIAAG